MSIELPKPIANFVAANARLDVDAMMRPFAENAVVKDNGKRFAGAPRIRALFEDEVLPVKAIFTPDSVRRQADHIVVAGPSHGDFPGSPLRFTYDFVIENDAITTLEITL